jgi:hypothetical protein
MSTTDGKNSILKHQGTYRFISSAQIPNCFCGGLIVPFTSQQSIIYMHTCVRCGQRYSICNGVNTLP